jgi:hypothetical protein
MQVIDTEALKAIAELQCPCPAEGSKRYLNTDVDCGFRKQNEMGQTYHWLMYMR